ncbi:MAG: hypothetical protein A3G35_18015 [candidate division NC10 bacterium RIFCSPLOWO2_12_FULL_66_18]|nr:MAG: hypothetical protein A3G35_18015 [candidate division NC10 bacterium RIFCSPLOWO2_12_FULL_66_18]
MRQRNPYGTWACLVLLLSAGFALSQGAANAATLALGEINPLSGRFAAHGTALHRGIQLAVEEANASGTLRVSLATRDDEARPDRAVAAAEELITRLRVAALVGGYVDSMVGIVVDVFKPRSVAILKGFLGAFGMEFPEVVRDLGPSGQFLFGTTGWEPGITEPGTEAASRAFVEGCRKRFGVEPPPLAMHGYVGARAILAAAKREAGRSREVGPEAGGSWPSPRSSCWTIRSWDWLPAPSPGSATPCGPCAARGSAS